MTSEGHGILSANTAVPAYDDKHINEKKEKHILKGSVKECMYYACVTLFSLPKWLALATASFDHCHANWVGSQNTLFVNKWIYKGRTYFFLLE